MAMFFRSIASGSSGNCLIAGNEKSHILIDAGVSCKKITDGIKKMDIEPTELDGILVTHEHSDHVQGLSIFSKKYHVPIYATEKTLYKILGSKCGEGLDSDLLYVIEPDRTFSLGSVEICPFAISHDAEDPVSYCLSDGKSRINMATDLGTFTDYTIDHLKDADILYIEANHDIAMLQVGSYPYYLKQRILSDRGHLCNERTGELVSKVMNDNLKNVILGHLSKENNLPLLAKQSVELEVNTFLKTDKLPFDLTVAPRAEVSDIFRTKE